jgi:hypothetical protein
LIDQATDYFRPIVRKTTAKWGPSGINPDGPPHVMLILYAYRPPEGRHFGLSRRMKQSVEGFVFEAAPPLLLSLS